ncbi:MAG: PIN domain-containing protein [Selenomonadaceae bacterium]|nr:PIN domain-containing protein [Selenomonadaceae bacterium]
MVMLDTNIILRYILDDNKEMADTAEEYIISDNAIITLEVIAEVVYVLRKVYSMERQNVVDNVEKVTELVYCEEDDVLNLALDTYSSNNLDFVDCILYAYNQIEGYEVATFDKKLLRLLNR